MRRPVLLSAALTALAVALAGCGDGGDGATDGPVVLATTAIIGDVARSVLADTAATVEVLMPEGADPHTYAPSASDARRVAEADLVLANGLGLEVALDDVLATAPDVVHLAELLDPIAFALSEDMAGHEGESTTEHAEHVEDGLDPHVWLDPERVAQMAREVAAAYARVAVDDNDAVVASMAAAEYAERMADLTEELWSEVETVPVDRRVLVSNHDALGYLAMRFGFEVVATVLPGSTTDAEVSAAGLRELVATLEAHDVRVVFTEPTGSDRVARSLAAELDDITLVELYTGSLGPAGSGADTVEGMLRTDVQRIVDALS